MVVATVTLAGAVISEELQRKIVVVTEDNNKEDISLYKGMLPHAKLVRPFLNRRPLDPVPKGVEKRNLRNLESFLSGKFPLYPSEWMSNSDELPGLILIGDITRTFTDSIPVFTDYYGRKLGIRDITDIVLRKILLTFGEGYNTYPWFTAIISDDANVVKRAQYRGLPAIIKDGLESSLKDFLKATIDDIMSEPDYYQVLSSKLQIDRKDFSWNEKNEVYHNLCISAYNVIESESYIISNEALFNDIIWMKAQMKEFMSRCSFLNREDEDRDAESLARKYLATFSTLRRRYNGKMDPGLYEKLCDTLMDGILFYAMYWNNELNYRKYPTTPDKVDARYPEDLR